LERSSRGETDKTQLRTESYDGLLRLVDLWNGLPNSFNPQKGRANYDDRIALEVYLKQIINDLKESLDCLYRIVAGIPVVGPVIAPRRLSRRAACTPRLILEKVVYQLKCYIDDILNITENLIDLALKDLIQPLLSDCSLSFLGLCGVLGNNECNIRLLGLEVPGL
jgi:hypothetical protein